MILDAAFLISVDRGERTARAFLTAAERGGRVLHTTEPVVAQVWREGAPQARLSAFLRVLTIHPLDDGQPVGRLLGHARTKDVVDAHLVVCAVRIGEDIVTGDPKDITALTAAFGPSAPTVHAWP